MLLRKRQMELLRKVATLARERHDVKVSLADLAPTLDRKDFLGGAKFVDKADPKYEGGSELAYDYNFLHTQGLIEHTYLVVRRLELGQRRDKPTHENPGVKVTVAGLQFLEEASKPWWKKAIEKQPMTFVQIIVTLTLALITGAGGWAIGRYLTPVEKPAETRTTR